MNKNAPSADINIFCETLYPHRFSSAPLNWFIPNPEWYSQEENYLESVDLILCRTHEVQRIFTELKKETFFIGFSSPDHYNPHLSKDYSSCLHLSGTSLQKGTFAILEAWTKHPEFPHLTMVKFPENERQVPKNVTWINDWLPEDELRGLQNKSGIHLCLSETEGFGHYLMEAMAVGAVVITTDAPPMNEFITDPRCLVPYTAWRFQLLGVNYYVNSLDIEAKIKELLKLPERELREISKTNRKNYFKFRNFFINNLEQLLEAKGRSFGR